MSTSGTLTYLNVALTIVHHLHNAYEKKKTRMDFQRRHGLDLSRKIKDMNGVCWTSLIDRSRLLTNVHVPYMLWLVLLSACNARAPYSAGWNFRQCFCTIWYLAIHWHPRKILRRSSQGNPYVGGGLNARGVAKYSDFGLINGYISETVQDRR